MFEKDQFVYFGYRISSSFGRRGWGAWSQIPKAFGIVLAVTDKSVVVKPDPKYSDRAQTFTLRKSGNWVMAGKPDDLHGRMNLEVCEIGLHSLSSGSALVDFAKEEGVDLLPQIERSIYSTVQGLQNELTQVKYDMTLDDEYRKYIVKDVSRSLKEANNELLSVRVMLKKAAE
jgi:hypothetical protein